MTLFKKFYSILLWVTLLALMGYSGYLYWERTHPCEQTITYKLGVIDPRFGVATSTFMKDIDEASGIWESAAGRDLFRYDPSGAMTINLIYDARQQTTDLEHTLTSEISATSQVASSVKQQYLSLTTEYNTALGSYKAELADYNQAQTAYNTRVSYWNARGGAPQKDYDALTAQKNALEEQQNAVEAKQAQVNQLATQVNALIDKYNLLVDHINTNVQTFNNDGLAGKEFEEGVYIKSAGNTEIDIYQFENKTFFIRVIAHELGHALGLGHNDDPVSIMNPINSSPSLVLSPEDLQALKASCNLK